MRRLMMTLEYDGTDFCGWQIQAEGRTVQGVLEEAVRRTTGEAVRVTGAGRTDAGVHAEGQVAHFDTGSALPPGRFLRALNYWLPDDIAVLDCREVAPDFDARFSASSKLYRYRILCSAMRRPLRERFTLREWRSLDVDAVRECAALLVGEHDFTSFASEHSEAESNVRRVMRSELLAKGDELHYLVEANGFLYNMVRIIVGTLLEVGRGKITAREFREILNACDRKAAGPTAPARGLTLVRVNYPNDARRTTWKTEDGGERMDFFEVIEGRASVRSFVKCEIPEADLTRILDAGRRAPSGHNHQPWEFILIRSPDTLKQLGKIQGCIAEASAAIAVVMDESASEFWKEDAGAAIENMLLATVALGYASLWVEGYVLRHEDYGKEVLDVPKDRRLLAILPIGKPASPPSQAQKKPLSEILHRERYGGA